MGEKLIHHVPDEKPKTVIFWLEHEVQYVQRLNKFFFKIAPCAKGEKKYQKLQVVRTILLKSLIQKLILEIFKRIVRITCIFSVFFPPFPDGAILEKIFVQSLHILNFMFKPKNSRFWIFIGYMMYGFLSQALLNRGNPLNRGNLCTLKKIVQQRFVP